MGSRPGIAPSPSRPLAIHGLRWWIAALLMGVTVVNYLDRTCLAVAAPALKAKLGLSEVDYAEILSAFQGAYLLTQPLAGRVIDWVGARLGLALSIAWWSAAQILAALASGWRAFAFLRGLLGIGEAGNFPGIAKVVSEWFPPRERTIATGVANMGAGIGQAAAVPLVIWLLSRYDWRVAFVTTGAIGCIWGTLWALAYRPPEEHAWLTAEERTHIVRERAPDPEADVTDGTWSTVLSDRNFWALAIARFLSEPAWQFFSYWIPSYLASERHLKLRDIGYFAWMPFVAADVGCLFGGALSPLFMRLGSSVIVARKLSTSICACLMVFAIFIGGAKSTGWAIAFFCVAAFAHQAMSSTLLTLPADLFPARAVATANGLSGTAGGLGGMGFTVLVGVVVMRIGYAPLFVAIALFDLVGSACLWAILRDPADPARAPRRRASMG